MEYPNYHLHPRRSGYPEEYRLGDEMPEQIWLSWEKNTRNQSLSCEIGAKLFQLEFHSIPIFRYPYLLAKTLSIIMKEKPRLIFVQNPSVVLALFVTIIGKISRKPVIVDAHNMGVLFEHSSKLVQYIGQTLNNLISSTASLTLVTNCPLARFVEQKKGRSFVLPDPLPKYQGYQRINFEKKRNVLCICSFSVDEPYEEIIKAAEYIDQDINIYVSGDNKKVTLPANLPKNVVFTGYLTEKEYISYLFSSDLIIDLTTRENLLVCGAYEAIAAEKPLLLSNTATLRSYFLNGALYCDNVAIDIASKINYAFENLALLKMRVKEIKDTKTREWLSFRNELDNYLVELLS